MDQSTLAIFLIVSVLGTFAAAVIALLPHPRAQRMSNTVLALSAVCGAFVGISLAVGETSTIALPSALYPAASAAASQPWPLFFDMFFGLDRFSAIFYGLLCFVSVLTAIFAVPYLERHNGMYNPRNVNVLTALFILGMQGVLLSTNIIGFMTFWEVMSIASFFLVLADGSEESRKAGFLYLIMTQLSAGAVMTGLFLLSGGALLSDFSVIALVTPNLSATSLAVALGLLLFGFGSKAGLVPFHVWLPEAHPQAPSHVSALMSGIMLNIALYGFLRVLLFMVPSVPLWFTLTVLLLGALSAVVGVLYAVLERDIKRLLAYSSIENLGIIFTVVGIGLLAGREGSVDLTQASVYAALFLAVSHALFKSGLFLSTGIISSAVHTQRLEQMGGLAKRMPQFSVAVCVLAITASALPPFAPFVGEWMFLQAMVGGLSLATPVLKVALVAAMALIGFTTGLALFAMVKMYAVAFLASPRSEGVNHIKEPEPGLLVPVGVLAVAGLLLGLVSPSVFTKIGALGLSRVGLGLSSAITVGGGYLMPVLLSVILALILLALLGLRRVVSNPENERTYQTWDCGQPMNPRMQYTATAFSAPIRFFFRFFLRTKKAVMATPVAPGNPWIASRTMELVVSQFWYDHVYAPLGKGLTKIATRVSRIQNGSVQFYITLILLTLFVTLIIAL